MLSGGVDAVVVVDRAQVPIGVVTGADLLRSLVLDREDDSSTQFERTVARDTEGPRSEA
jgi:hypothetical protein